MTTRAVKRLASASVSGAQGVNVAGEKKRRRHYVFQESIKRAVKKRADAIKTMGTFGALTAVSHLSSAANQRKPSSIHDTHNQFNKLPKLTPLELARMKADKDQNTEVQVARKRQEEALRQSLLREQAQRGGIPHVRSSILVLVPSDLYFRVAQFRNHKINSCHNRVSLLRLPSLKFSKDKLSKLSKHSPNNSSSWHSYNSFRRNNKPISLLGGPLRLQRAYRLDRHGWPREPLRMGGLSIRKHRRISCNRSERCKCRCSCRLLLKPT
jgi:hypothetical protein